MPSSDHPLSCRLAACLLALCGTAHAQAPSLDADTVLQMHRLQQLELATGRPLALATALCMDERLGAAWKLPGTGAMPPSRWQPVAERMRLMAEQCTVQDDDRQYRDTASWRAALEQKLQRRTQMEAERQRLRHAGGDDRCAAKLHRRAWPAAAHAAGMAALADHLCQPRAHMNRRFLARRRLMQAACASLVAPWVHASGDDGGTAPDANLFPVLQAKVKTAMALLSNKQFLAAQPLLAEALAVVDADPARRWPWRVYVLPTYGFAELGLGRTQVAVDALRLAVQAEERIAAEQLQPFAQLSAAMDRAMGKQLLKVEYGRQMLTAIGAPGTLRTVGELPYDTDHSAAELWFTTARALHANGDVEELARFYRQHVAPRRAATEDVPAVLAQEYRHFKIGLLLWQAGQHDAAAEAFAAALDSNSQRFSHMDQTSTTMEAVWSAFVMRRTILAAQLEQARQNGALDSAVPVLLARLVSAKG
ncbi:MAG: hypothetical protein RSH52_16010, partial [Janthinobacterium sp.]